MVSVSGKAVGIERVVTLHSVVLHSRMKARNSLHTLSDVLLTCASCCCLPCCRCVNCVLNREPCATCIPYPGTATTLATPAQGRCMNCIAAKGKRFAGSCITCSISPDPSKCIKCLDSFFPKMTCTTADYNGCYKPDFDNPCAMCQKVSGTSYDSCISCFSNPKSKVDCESCSVLSSPTAQSTCFSCSAKVPSSTSGAQGGCGLCFAHSKNTATLNQCVSCLTAAGTSSKRGYCSLCSSSELTGEQSARCFKCLEGKSGSAGCSTCATKATSAAAFDSCMMCHADKANGPDCHDCETLGSNLAPAARDAMRKRCWECVVSSKLVVPQNAGSAPLGSCQSCFASSSADTAACVSCNTNPLVPTIAKGWCIACAAKPAAERDACVKCLAANKLPSTPDYRAKCKI